MPQITAIGEILFDVYQDTKKLGGAPFNFIYHVKKLTGQGNFISRIGNDEPGNEIIRFLKKNNFSLSGIQTDPIHKTGAAKPKLNPDKIPEWTIEENTAYDFIEYNNEVERLIKNDSDSIYFGTLAQRRERSKTSIQKTFNQPGKKYFCDLNIRQNFYTKELVQKCLMSADILKLNIDELKLVNDLLLEDGFDTLKTSQKVKTKFGIDLLCVTNGSEGARLFCNNEISSYKADVPEDKIVDTVGAGDAFAAILCIGKLKNWNIDKINKLACEFSAEVVKINGALPDDDSFYEVFKSKLN